MAIPDLPRADFYSALDSVRFNSAKIDKTTLRYNQVGATGTMMLGLLIGDARPILSQPQAFDSRYLLSVLENQDADTSGFLRLVEQGIVNVRFHDDPPLLDGPERFSLVNAFASALDRKQGFLLSGWPEINADYALREELVRAITSTPAGGLVSEVEGLAGQAVAQRLKGLMIMDKALAKAGPATLTTRLPQGSYSRRVIGYLNNLAGQRADAEPAVRWLLGHTTGSPPKLELRSSWYELVNLYRRLHPDQGAVLDVIQARVDFASHKQIAQSLGSTGDEFEVPDIADADSMATTAGGDNIPVNRWTALETDERRTKWMTWSEIPALWQELERFSVTPADRLEYLIKKHKEEIFVRRRRGGGWIEVGIAVIGGTAENWTSGSLSAGVLGAAAAASAGQLTLVAVSAAVRRSSWMRDWLKGRSDARWERSVKPEASVSAGTASWQDEIGS